MDCNTAYRRWCEKVTDIKTKAELARQSADDIRRYFTSALEFGTAGLRGIMTAGPGAMNIYTVRAAAYGVAEYVKRHEDGKPVAIACDTRQNSRLFCECAAEVIAAAGLRCLTFAEPRPTPELSFAVRRLGCGAGINITASHNPKEYNGFKVYGADGAQISEKQADEISGIIAGIDCFEVPHKPADRSLLSAPDADIDDDYIAAVLSQSRRGDVDKSLQIVYTPLHGAGCAIVPRMLKKAGYMNVHNVAEQLLPDGLFPTVARPNPEFPEAFRLGIALAKLTGATLVLANDPDCDRAGAALRMPDGGYQLLSGNQIGALLLDYLLCADSENGRLPDGAYAVKSIVSTRLCDRICARYGVVMRDVPTGFKHIGEQIERDPSGFVFGFEESNGYLAGNYARDKDGALAVLLLTEAAAYYRTKNMTLADRLERIDAEYGCYRESTENVVETGVDAKAVIDGRMKRLRADPPRVLAGEPVTRVTDYASPSSPIPGVNMLGFQTDGGELLARPSGTEPKLKLYIHVHADSPAAADRKTEAMRRDALALLHD